MATPLIERNTTIPTRKSQIFSTASDSQTQVEIHVLQGERPMAADNKIAGQLHPGRHPARPARHAADRGDLRYRCQRHPQGDRADKATGRSQHITITASSGLSEAEIEKMRKDAEAHAEEDRRRKELIEVRNQADNDHLHRRKDAARPGR